MDGQWDGGGGSGGSGGGMDNSYNSGGKGGNPSGQHTPVVVPPPPNVGSNASYGGSKGSYDGGCKGGYDGGGGSKGSYDSGGKGGYDGGGNGPYGSGGKGGKDSWDNGKGGKDSWDGGKGGKDNWDRAHHSKGSWDGGKDGKNSWDGGKDGNNGWDGSKGGKDSWNGGKSGNDSWDGGKGGKDSWDGGSKGSYDAGKGGWNSGYDGGSKGSWDDGKGVGKGGWDGGKDGGKGGWDGGKGGGKDGGKDGGDAGKGQQDLMPQMMNMMTQFLELAAKGGDKKGSSEPSPWDKPPPGWQSKRTDGYGYWEKPENKEWYDNWADTSGWIDFSKQPRRDSYKSSNQSKEKEEEPAGDVGGWSSMKNSPLPTIVGISVGPTCKLVAQGYPTDVAAMEYSKDIAIFSDAHHILQDFFPDSVNDKVHFDHDPECNLYPEVFAAWKAAGQEDNCPTIATCPSLGQWAVGFGGKTNANRAAKLSLALTVAAVIDKQKLKVVVSHYPQFGQLCQIAGIEVPGGVPMPLPTPGAPPTAEQLAMQQLQQQLPPSAQPQLALPPGQLAPPPPPPQIPLALPSPGGISLGGMDPAIAAAAAQAAAQLAAQNPDLMQAQQAGQIR